jgi:hypothetical protein
MNVVGFWELGEVSGSSFLYTPFALGVFRLTMSLSIALYFPSFIIGISSDTWHPEFPE